MIGNVSEITRAVRKYPGDANPYRMPRKIEKSLNYVGGEWYYQRGIAKIVNNFFTERLPTEVIGYIDSFLEHFTYKKHEDGFWDMVNRREARQEFENPRLYKIESEMESIIENHKVMNWTFGFGKYKGKSYYQVFKKDKGYTNWLFEKNVIKNKAIIDFYFLIRDLWECREQIENNRRPINYD